MIPLILHIWKQFVYTRLSLKSELLAVTQQFRILDSDPNCQQDRVLCLAADSPPCGLLESSRKWCWQSDSFWVAYWRHFIALFVDLNCLLWSSSRSNNSTSSTIFNFDLLLLIKWLIKWTLGQFHEEVWHSKPEQLKRIFLQCLLNLQTLIYMYSSSTDYVTLTVYLTGLVAF